MIGKVTGVVYLVFAVIALLAASQSAGSTRVAAYAVAGIFAALGIWRFLASFRK